MRIDLKFSNTIISHFKSFLSSTLNKLDVVIEKNVQEKTKMY